MENDAQQNQTSGSSKKRHIVVAICVIVVILGLVTGLVVIKAASKKTVVVPAAIRQQVHFAMYLPQTLPGNFKIDPGSFSFQENVLIFKATDGIGGSIVFTEQPRPKNFNFDEFYRTQLQESNVLSDVPYPSVWGKVSGGRMALSIVANDTWVLATASSSINGNDMQHITQGLQKY